MESLSSVDQGRPGRPRAGTLEIVHELRGACRRSIDREIARAIRSPSTEPGSATPQAAAGIAWPRVTGPSDQRADRENQGRTEESGRKPQVKLCGFRNQA